MPLSRSISAAALLLAPCLFVGCAEDVDDATLTTPATNVDIDGDADMVGDTNDDATVGDADTVMDEEGERPTEALDDEI